MSEGERRRARLRRKRNRSYGKRLMKHALKRGCRLCPARAEHLHHRDPKTKLAEVSALVNQGRSRTKIRAEVAKCDPLCAPCHRHAHGHDRAFMRRVRTSYDPSWGRSAPHP